MSSRNGLVVAMGAVLAAGMLAAPAQGAYLESDYGGEGPVIRPVPAPAPRPPRRYYPPHPPLPPVRVENEVRRLLSRVTVGGPYVYNGLAVYPLYASGGGGSSQSYLTLDEALRRGDLEISELGRARVGHIHVRNRGHLPVFIMQGEGIAGGRQNRLSSGDVLLAPGVAATIPVYCMEERRWAGGTKFREGIGLAPERLRRSAAKGASQRQLWGEVDDALEAAGAPSATRDLAAATSSKKARDHCGGYVSYFRRVPRRALAGVALARWGRVTSIDLFESEHLAREHWDRIITSSSFELLPYAHYWGHGRRRRHVYPSHPGVAEVRRLLRSAYDARMRRSTAPGSGESISISGSGVSGSAATWRGEAVHVSIWGQLPVRPRPVPMHR